MTEQQRDLLARAEIAMVEVDIDLRDWRESIWLSGIVIHNTIDSGYRKMYEKGWFF